MIYSAIHLGAIGGNNDADIFTQNEEKDVCRWEARTVMLLMAYIFAMVLSNCTIPRLDLHHSEKKTIFKNKAT